MSWVPPEEDWAFLTLEPAGEKGGGKRPGKRKLELGGRWGMGKDLPCRWECFAGATVFSPGLEPNLASSPQGGLRVLRYENDLAFSLASGTSQVRSVGWSLLWLG